MESKSGDNTANISEPDEVCKTVVSVGTDRSGKLCPTYRESLPPFLAAAADGEIGILRQYIDAHIQEEDGNSSHCNDKINNNVQAEDRRIQHIKDLISCRDRKGSTAEHWSAGGGHIACLSYLLELRDIVSATESNQSTSESADTSNADGEAVSANNSSDKTFQSQTKIRRRRDGKTCLHYASRNGHISCIKLLLSRPDAPSVDIRSGDGTTPLHLACYGGHPSSVRMFFFSSVSSIRV
jgi:ankyrin repeat protein